MRVAADGFIDISDGRKVRTPGLSQEQNVDPMPEAEALSFLLSHSFPGHRRIVRSLTVAERKRIRMAAWADSIAERMGMVDRIWRSITEPMLMTTDPGRPFLVQIVQYGHWAYPVYLDGGATRVLPPGGVPVGEVRARTKEVLQLDRKTA